MSDTRRGYRQGIYVFIALGILSLLEYFVALRLDGPMVPIFIIALVKAGLIVQYFMHIYRLWREEKH